MSRVKIVNCGVPPRGCQVEYGLKVDGSIVMKSQGFPDGNIRQRAEEEALALGLTYYVNERGSGVYFSDSVKLGEIRGPIPTSEGNPYPYVAYVRGQDGWIYFHGRTSADALKQAKDCKAKMIC